MALVRVGVWARREGNAGFELGRHLVLAAMPLLEVIAHRVGRHSELAERALDRLYVRGGRGSAASQELSAPAAPVAVAHPIFWGGVEYVHARSAKYIWVF